MSIEYFYEKYEIFVKILRYDFVMIVLQIVKFFRKLKTVYGWQRH